MPLHFKKLLTGSHGGDAQPDLDIPRYIRLMKVNKMTLDGIITHEFALDEINEALELFRSGEAGRIIIKMNRQKPLVSDKNEIQEVDYFEKRRTVE